MTFSFDRLQTPEGIRALDTHFLAFLATEDASAQAMLLAYREHPLPDALALSHLILTLSPYIDAYIIDLFAIEGEAGALKEATLANDPLFVFQKHFVQRLAKRRLKEEGPLYFNENHAWLMQSIGEECDVELSIAVFATGLLADEESNAAEIERVTTWCIACLKESEAMTFVTGWASFKMPERIDLSDLILLEPVDGDLVGRQSKPAATLKPRDGFELTDKRMSLRDTLNEIHYCVYCHTSTGDFCSKGFPVKKKQPELGLKQNSLDNILTGCPLDEKISEMNLLKKSGYAIGALATIMRDNPLCAMTGHRICNDCMKACIYQKQEPVNIPEIETRILTDVLSLPYGVEIYDLLMRWNPLRHTDYCQAPFNGKSVFIMGMGPAGITLSHHLTQAGYAVTGADGLKIEPLSNAYLNGPIRHYAEMSESLDERVMAGFGGVAEYGITVRWDKNFLKLIYIVMMRRQHFSVHGSVRFGGTLTVEDVWDMGYDHLTVAVGAGLPRELTIPNSLAPGMRQANDFLMSLQLTGAAKKGSLINLQIRLPAVVIGGGLTGVDTATEIQAYYIRQVEKVAEHYEMLCENLDENTLRQRFTPYDLSILDEFLLHATLVRAERVAANADNRTPFFLPLIRAWGGVTIVYRRAMQESPAYRSNHEELSRALDEGIYYAPHLQPTAVQLDSDGHATSLTCDRTNKEEEITLPARSILVATGAKPNVAYEFEHKGTFVRHGFQYQPYHRIETSLLPSEPVQHVKSPDIGMFTSYENEGRMVSYIGDTHPVFQGNVVKAIASATYAYPKITALLSELAPRASVTPEMPANATLVKKTTGPNGSLQLIVNAPQCAKHHGIGQFYRLQAYETAPPVIAGQPFQMEAIAALGARCQNNPDQLQFTLYKDTPSARILAHLPEGAPIALMGPTGATLPLPKKKHSQILLIGDKLLYPFLAGVYPTWQADSHQVIGYVVGQDDIFSQYANIAVFDDFAAIERALTSADCKPDQILVIGEPALVCAVSAWRASNIVFENADWIAAVYGPMQCMLKGVCAQCLQWQVDPDTGERTKAVYACSWQHQPMNKIDMHHLFERTSQNRCQETLTTAVLDHWEKKDELSTNNA